MQLSNVSTPALEAKLQKLDLVYHITQDVQQRYNILRAEDDIKIELVKRKIDD